MGHIWHRKAVFVLGITFRYAAVGRSVFPREEHAWRA
jgi:hypothetical protein